jgi:formate hydrogenlyase subunit 6/NADH:ubiquinone oxidoreductase subunit I
MRGKPSNIVGTALKNLFKTSATEAYQNSIPETDNKMRGKLCFSAENCIGCKLCVMDCPAGALKIENVGTKEDKKMVATLNIGHCIFCCQCVDSCRRGCLHFTSDIKLAQLDKNELTVEL